MAGLRNQGSPWDSMAAFYTGPTESPSDTPDSLVEFALIDWPAVIDFLSRSIGVFHGSRILDAGCGTGYLTGHLARLGAHAVGLDPSAEMIAAARRHSPNVDFRVGDLGSLPAAETFDAVLLLLVCPFVADLAPLIESAVAHVRDGGLLVLSGCNPAFVASALRTGTPFREFDDVTRPRRGLYDPSGKNPIPVYVRNADEYTYVCEVFGLRLIFEARPPFTRSFVERHPRPYATDIPPRIILGFRKGD